MKEMVEVQIRKQCAGCDGKGIIVNPVWEEFMAEHESHVPAEEIDQWFRERGMNADAEPEEIECDDCAGSDHVYQWVDINTVLGDLARRLEAAERAARKAANDAGCLANGIIPD